MSHRGQGLIDLNTFFEAQPLGMARLGSLAPCKIDKMNLKHGEATAVINKITQCCLRSLEINRRHPVQSTERHGYRKVRKCRPGPIVPQPQTGRREQ